MKQISRTALTKLTTIVVLVALAFYPVLAYAQEQYSITDLGSISEASDNEGALAINDRGEVVGGSKGRAFLWSDGARRDLGTLAPLREEDTTMSVAYSINNRGVVVGSSGSFQMIFMSGLQFARGIITHQGKLRQFTDNVVSFFPYAINDTGQVAGLDEYRGFFYTKGKIIPLGTLSKVPQGNRSRAVGLNQAGRVVGWSTAGKSPMTKYGELATHAFLWQRQGKSGRMRDLGTLPGWVNSYAYSINRQGEIAGSVSDVGSGSRGVYADSRKGAFLWRSGKMTSLGILAGSKNSEAFGINDSTEVVGASDNRAFLWARGKILDLNAFLPSGSGWTLEEARAINNKGQIVGSGRLNGQAHMFLLTPQT